MFREQVFRPTTVRRICVRVAVSSTNTKYFFGQKKSSAAWKLTPKSVHQHVRLVFANNILFGEKIILSLICHVCEYRIEGFRINQSVFTIIMSVLHSHFGYSSRLLVRCERYEVRRNGDIHSRTRIVDKEARHSRLSRFLWLGTDLPTCFQELWDETRTSRECGR